MIMNCGDFTYSYRFYLMDTANGSEVEVNLEKVPSLSKSIKPTTLEKEKERKKRSILQY